MARYQSNKLKDVVIMNPKDDTSKTAPCPLGQRLKRLRT